MRHADVYDADLGTHMGGQYTDPGAPSQKVQDHLSGDGTRISTDAFLRDPVIGCKGEDRRTWKLRTFFPSHRHIAGRQFLQPSQASDWFGELIKASLGLLQTGLIHGTDLLNGLVECHHFTRVGSLLRTKYTASAS